MCIPIFFLNKWCVDSLPPAASFCIPRKVHCDLEVLRQAVRLLRDGSDVDDIPKGTAAEAPESWLRSILIKQRPTVFWKEAKLLRCDGKKSTHWVKKGHLNCLFSSYDWPSSKISIKILVAFFRGFPVSAKGAAMG